MKFGRYYTYSYNIKSILRCGRKSDLTFAGSNPRWLSMYLGSTSYIEARIKVTKRLNEEFYVCP